MAVSKMQPMREAEQDIIGVVNGQIGQISTLEQGLEDTNTVVGQLSQELGTEIDRAKAAEQINARAIEALQDDVNAFPVFRFGTLEFNDLQTDSSAVLSVEFEDVKEFAPYVFLTVEDIEVEGHIAECAAIVTALSTSGFTVRCWNNSADTANVVVDYLVIGE